MATYFAVASGNVNGTIWASTPAGAAITPAPYPFTSADILVANTYTVTINVDTTAQEIRNDTTGGATAGGGYNFANSAKLTANVYGGSAAAITGSGDVYVIGNVFGGTGGHGVSITATTGYGTNITVVGNVTGGTTSGTAGIVATACNVSITGNVISGSASACYGVSVLASTYTITGNIYSNAATGLLVQTSSSGTVNGNAISASTLVAMRCNGAGTNTLNGTAFPSSGAAGATNEYSGTLIVKRAKGNNFGGGLTGVTAQPGVNNSSNGTCIVYELEYGDFGQSPTAGPITFLDATTNKAIVYCGSGLKKTLTDARSVSGRLPSPSDVRAGVSYNLGTSTGTCAVPAASSVAVGVAVDATVGTNVLTAAGIYDELTANSRVSGSYGERLKTIATTDSLAQQLNDLK